MTVGWGQHFAHIIALSLITSKHLLKLSFELLIEAFTANFEHELQTKYNAA